ncbi:MULTISPECIES: UDP-N-acetylmuramate--L-alanine ligase [unclassified Apibacter]|uniref:UDP-N-acetylmuramate--L-alanine ligase n=1 Tax=unclassified Apibacter TaxID=2630820 RepID=UPI0013263A72|nr:MULTISPECIES: Mur ligase family protein [unclassified Apibacter]MCX8676118.1 peptidoglycan synthetase [Apibacter sp. B3919]MXO25336.1 peptidoglycan synthetase [Apibacter sp. B3924]MXO27451.1 peptidoglycan synthetase [Apibacter sp. B3813]MXO29264.1 peptidoglycan synthetase [Apibacter sp. B3913]MXO31009.1 peptidoglycan synthetase [Apibacter sp. B3912]
MKIHFIAIGGSAMHNLALALAQKGYTVTGSDDAIFEPSLSRLKKQGIAPNSLGWFPDKITPDIDAVILGMHAHSDNPELQKAKELNLKIYSYPEFLYEQSKNKTRVVIAGSHGKTTITSMVLHVLKYHQVDVDYMVGAQLEGFDTMVKLTDTNEFMILEGDEYLSSPIDLRSKFLLYQPNIALLSGIAWDHINVFPTFESYKQPFLNFVNTISQGGALIYNEEDKEVVEIAEQSSNYLKKFPYHTPNYVIKDEKVYLQTSEGELQLSLFGRHNLLNLEGARLVCNQIGIQNEAFYEAILSFKGASRRLEKIYETNEYIVYKDFAHAPSKVMATVKAVKENFSNKRLVACLELHTYSSLNPEFLKQYKNTLDKADEALVFYSEDALKIKRMEPISKELIINSFEKNNLQVFTDPVILENYLKEIDKNNSIFLMMSSGNYGGINLDSIFK